MDLGAGSLGSHSVNLIDEDHGGSTDLCSTCNQHKQLELGVPGRYLGGIKQLDGPVFDISGSPLAWG